MSQKVSIPEFRLEDIPLSCTWIAVGPPGSGKCLAPGTPIVMYDGSIRNVENIEPGDLLMGDDSTPRRVFTTTTGEDKMYCVKQTKGDDYTVNEPHILVLKRTYMPRIIHNEVEHSYNVSWMFDNGHRSRTFSYKESVESSNTLLHAENYLDSLRELKDYTRENYLEISVKDYMKMDMSLRKKYKGYRVGIDFHTPMHISYNSRVIGWWLEIGDGSPTDPRFVPRSKQLADNISFALECCGLRMGGQYAAHPHAKIDDIAWKEYISFLKKYNLLNNKHIPSVFKSAPRQDRLLLLAGLIEANESPNGDDYYEIIQGNDTISTDIVYLARSCGFYTTIHICEDTCGNLTNQHNHIRIRGRDLYHIPVLRNNITTSISITDECECSEIDVTYLGIGTYHGFQIDRNQRFLLGDFTVTHNTTFMENMSYYLKHRYPVARLFIGTEGGYQRMCKIFHPLYVSNYYEEEEEKNLILRQRTCELENGKGYPGNYAINIIDDASDDPRIYKTKVMKGLFKLGSQHWNQLLMVGSQYAIDMPPDVRKSVSYAAVFFEPEEIERKKLYNNLGGLAGSYNNFCDLMDQLTGDYSCIIFKKRTQSHKIEENISYFRTKPLGDWKFGCKEYRDWARERYDPDYKEQIYM